MKSLIPSLFLVLTSTLLAQDKSHTFNFTVVLKDLHGNPAMDSMDPKTAKPITLGYEVATALLLTLDTDKGESPGHEIGRTKLALKLQDCKSCELGDTEIGIILDRAHQMPQAIPPLMFTQMNEILDPISFKKAEM